MDTERERRRQARAAIVEAGGPVYAPAGRKFARWKVTGWSGRGEQGVVSALSIGTNNFRQGWHLTIDTRFDLDHEPPESFITSQLLSDAVSRDVTFPVTVTVTRADVLVPIDRSATTPMTLYRAEGAWIALGEIGGRALQIRSSGVSPDDLSLHTIDDVAGLPDSRWP
jgi:hypothetical protein